MQCGASGTGEAEAEAEAQAEAQEGRVGRRAAGRPGEDAPPGWERKGRLPSLAVRARQEHGLHSSGRETSFPPRRPPNSPSDMMTIPLITRRAACRRPLTPAPLEKPRAGHAAPSEVTRSPRSLGAVTCNDKATQRDGAPPMRTFLRTTPTPEPRRVQLSQAQPSSSALLPAPPSTAGTPGASPPWSAPLVD